MAGKVAMDGTEGDCFLQNQGGGESMSRVAEFMNMDLRQPSGLRAENLEQFLQGSALAGLGQTFIEAEARHGINARYFCAHAVLESGWGTSRIACDKKNLFGFGAYDKDPYRYARTFQSYAECIDVVAAYIADNYLSPVGKYYHGSHLVGMNKKYATDRKWAEKIARLMDKIPDTVPAPPQEEKMELEAADPIPAPRPEPDRSVLKFAEPGKSRSRPIPAVRKVLRFFDRKRK